MSLTQIKENEITKFYNDEIISVDNYSGNNYITHVKNDVYLLIAESHIYKARVTDENTGEIKDFKYIRSGEKYYRKLVESYEIKETHYAEASYTHNENIEIAENYKDEVYINYFAESFKTEGYTAIRRQLEALKNRDIFLLNAESIQWKEEGLKVQNKIVFIPKEIITYAHLNKFLEKFETVEVLYQNIEIRLNKGFINVLEGETQVYLVHNTEYEFRAAKKVFFKLVQNKKEHDNLRDLLFFDQVICENCELAEDDCNCTLELCTDNNCKCGSLTNEDEETLADTDCVQCGKYCECDYPF